MSNDERGAPPEGTVGNGWAGVDSPAHRTPSGGAAQTLGTAAARGQEALDPFAPPPPHSPQYAPPEPQPTNRWAVVSLISSLFGVFPLGIGAGVVALNQLRHRQEQGKGMAIAGIAVSGAVALVGVGAAVASLVMAAYFGAGLLGMDDEFVATGTAEELAALNVGDCFDDAGGDGPVDEVECDGSHEGEVYLRTPLQASWQEYPGEEELFWAADEQCYEAFEGYVGKEYESSEFDFSVYAPDEESWAAGDRTLVCTICLYGEPIVGPARGSGR